jgi:hypothetical protein
MSILKLLLSISRLNHDWVLKYECFTDIGLQRKILNFHSVSYILQIYGVYILFWCFKKKYFFKIDNYWMLYKNLFESLINLCSIVHITIIFK